ncbi:MAG: hypothetical protein XD48_0060 [Archaeoglobus fulgidus]|uniref:Uncharacterized protein n=2 Tax=Archaeoglobus fulgidus TaxID=2234 RepID=A0A101E3M8_ARCFL|nr:MAG: hypothetical protein XD48_0060 [Archaeoglobus fulgidus]
MLDELELLKAFREERNPVEVFNSHPWGFSRATFYRRLEKLRKQGLLDWRNGKARITERGERLLELFDSGFAGERSGALIDRDDKKPDTNFCIIESDRLKQLEGFIYIPYPSASYILKTLLLYAGIPTKGLSTNAEKFKALVKSDLKTNLAIDNFENSSRQTLVFLRELINAGKLEKVYVGVRDERKALRNGKLLDFLQEFGFESGRLRLESDSVTLFPLLLVILIGFGIIIAYRLGVEYAPVYAFFIVIYFLRSSLFREIRK